ncbi:hypothetical protein EPO34_02840 [Patescibacteria group bacterium]|nr:MAG: hypothetical protein EPO34_02840 [Patescibacteria group bacterium]
MFSLRQPHRLKRTASMLVVTALLAFAAASATWFSFLKDTAVVRAAALSCPFSDSDGGTSGVQVTGSVSIDDVDDGGGSVGDYYDCTASLVEIKAGATVTLGSNIGTGAIAEIHFSDLEIENTATVSASVQGCGGTTSSGYGPNGSNVCTAGAVGSGANSPGGVESGGGGHGGAGGNGHTGSPGGATYDSATAAVLFGSSGGTVDSTTVGGTGGGAVRLSVSGTFTHNGSITANGGSGYIHAGIGGSGGGSGGSIYVTTAAIEGTTGTFSADGGAGYDQTYDAGGGGGGRIAIEYQSGSFSFDSSDFSASGGPGPGAATAGDTGTVYLVDTQGTGPTTDDDVKVFHGFTYTDTDYDVNSWTFDANADNQYCQNGISSGATPSITAGTTLNFDGTFTCGQTIASFTLSAPVSVAFLTGSTFSSGGAFSVTSAASASINTGATIASAGAMTLGASGFFTVGSGVTLTNTGTDTDINLNIPDGDDQSWSGLTVNGALEGELIIDDAIDITLTGSSAVNANVTWTTLTSLTIDSGSSISAAGKGCRSSTGHGYGPDGSNVCAVSTSGYGFTGGAWDAGDGAGHGGAGGNGSGGGTGGVTYGSATAPSLFGSSGGGASPYSGGAGGGKVRLDVSGTFTHNGSVSANGSAGGTSGGEYSAGGGSGGSVYVTAGSFSCTSAPTFQTTGGAGGNGTFTDGGGGGGGRIAIAYASASAGCSFDAGADTIGGSGASVLAAGGSGPDSAADGSAGTLSLTLTDDPPAFSTAVNAAPSTPTVNQQTTISATATDDNGVNRIQLYLDGTTDPTNVIKTCTFSPAESPASCSITIGPGLSDGSHTIRAAARDTASATTNSDSSFTVGSFTTSGTMTFSRLKAGSTGVDFALQFALTGPDTAPLTVTFPAGFTVTQAFTSGTCSGGGTVGSFGYTATTLTGTKTACVGTITLSGAKVTLHSTPGTYVVTWSNDSGSGSFTVVDEDQVTVSGMVDPTLTFDLDLSVGDAETSGPYSLDFGEIMPGTVASSGTTHKSVWIDLSTNATGGAVVTVRNVNGSSGLVSASAPADTIPNSAAAMSSSTANYGLCVISVTQTAGGPFAKAGDYTAGTCAANGATNDVKNLTTTNASILSTTSDPIDAGRARVSVNVNATPVTAAHADYGDALTFIATATY